MHKIPYLDFMGTPLGIDLKRVLKTKIAPVVNTGLAQKNYGIGHVGAGIHMLRFSASRKPRKLSNQNIGVQFE